MVRFLALHKPLLITICALCLIIGASFYHLEKKHQAQGNLLTQSDSSPSRPMPSPTFLEKLTLKFPKGIPWRAEVMPIAVDKYLLLADIEEPVEPATHTPKEGEKRKIWIVSPGKAEELSLGRLGGSLHLPYEIRFSPPYLLYAIRDQREDANFYLSSKFFSLDMRDKSKRYLGEFTSTGPRTFTRAGVRTCILSHIAIPSPSKPLVIERELRQSDNSSSRCKIKVYEGDANFSFTPIDHFEDRPGSYIDRPCAWETREGVILSTLVFRPVKNRTGDEVFFVYKKKGEKGWHYIDLGDVGFFDYRVSQDGQKVALLLKEEENERILKVFSLATGRENLRVRIKGEERENRNLGAPEAVLYLLLPSHMRWDDKGGVIIAFPRETTLDKKSTILWLINVATGEIRKREVSFQKIWDARFLINGELAVVAGNPLAEPPTWGVYVLKDEKHKGKVAEVVYEFKPGV